MAPSNCQSLLDGLEQVIYFGIPHLFVCLVRDLRDAISLCASGAMADAEESDVSTHDSDFDSDVSWTDLYEAGLTPLNETVWRRQAAAAGKSGVGKSGVGKSVGGQSGSSGKSSGCGKSSGFCRVGGCGKSVAGKSVGKSSTGKSGVGNSVGGKSSGFGKNVGGNSVGGKSDSSGKSSGCGKDRWYPLVVPWRWQDEDEQEEEVTYKSKKPRQEDGDSN